LTGKAACDVNIHYIVYMTRDPAGNPATASEAVFVPSGSAAACTGSRPVLLYAHGTNASKSYNIADIKSTTDATTQQVAYENAAGGEGSLLVAMYAAQGFIVVAPNYLGYDVSSLNYHPYLDGEAQAVDMVDGLRAAENYLKSNSITPSSKLFVSGYSQGGYVAMATDKIIARDYGSEFTVTGSVPMSGPYNLVGFSDAVLAGYDTGVRSLGSLVFAPMLVESYQHAYGNVYTKASDAYQSPYDTTVPTLFPDPAVTGTSGWAPLITPPNNPLPPDPTFTTLFGTGGLFTDSFKTAYMTSDFRGDLVKNTLVGTDAATSTTISWAPTHPMLLCGGANDPTVFWAPNGQTAGAIFASAGLQVPALDLENQALLDGVLGATEGDQIYLGFQQAKQLTAQAAVAAGATDGGQSAVLGAYHGTLEPPFCNAIARGFFSTLLAAQ
jgi:hypothetical protein